MGWVILVSVSIFSVLILIKAFINKCSSCGRLMAMKTISSKPVSSKTISIKKEIKQKNAKGEVIGTSETYIPGTRITYYETYKCKYCGNVKYGYRDRDFEN